VGIGSQVKIFSQAFMENALGKHPTLKNLKA